MTRLVTWKREAKRKDSSAPRQWYLQDNTNDLIYMRVRFVASGAPNCEGWVFVVCNPPEIGNVASIDRWETDGGALTNAREWWKYNREVHMSKFK